MLRLKLTIAYVGTLYHGWQIQLRKNEEVYLPTIQGLLEQNISRVVGLPVHVHGSGRTDAGVHAEGQVAHVDIPDTKKNIDWQVVLNSLLPPDIRIIECEYSDFLFHAQHGVRKKIYAYRLWLHQKYTPPHLYPFVWACRHLDLAVMDEAAKHLVGKHDFVSLQNKGTQVTSTVRTVSNIYRISPQAHDSRESGYEIVWFFEASGFLKQMVRNIMGLLVSVGLGKVAPKDIPLMLESKKRISGFSTAPAKGLVLKHVEYH